MKLASAGLAAAALRASGWSARDRHERGAEDGVGPRRVDFELALAGRRGARRERPADQHALGAADPVSLHEADLFRPAVERVQAVEQLLRHRRDLEEPLRQVALLDRRVGAPAAPVDHLLVGEHGHVDRVPVDLGGLALDQAGAPEVEEHFLLVLVVARIAGGDLAAPVQRQAHGLELGLHGRDVGVGPVARIDLVVARRVFGRQAEGVPSHRMQHVAAHGAAEARHDVAHRVVAHMPHMDVGPTDTGTSPACSISGAGRRWRRQKASPRPRPSASGIRTRADCIVRLPLQVNRFRRNAA